MSLLAFTLLPIVREYLGLSQDETARYLSIPRERVSAAERGARPLSGPATAALYALVAALPPEARVSLAKGALPPAPPAEGPPDAAALRRYAQQCRLDAARLRAELTRLEQRAAQARARLALADTFPTLPPAGPRADPAWGTRLLRQARAWLQEANPTALALLAVRIAALEHAAALAEAAAA